MKDIILLTKILFKSSLNNKAKSSKKGFGKILFFIILYLYLAVIVGYVAYQSINSLLLFNQEKIFITLSFIGISIFTVFQTIFTSLNVLFFSKDIEILLQMPVEPYKIIMAKFNCLILSQYIMYSILIVPILLVYGYILKMYYLYYLISFIIVLLLPIIPVIVTSFFVILIMKFTSIIKNKDTIQYITVGITMILVITVQFLVSNTNDEITNVELANKLIETNMKLENYSKFFINLNPLTQAIFNYNNWNCIKNLIIVFIETILLYNLVSFGISKTYIKSVLKLNSIGTKKSKKIDNRDIIENNIGVSYVKKEFKNLNRNPIFFMQCVLPSLVFPLIILLPIIFSINNENTLEILEVQKLISNTINTGTGFTICICIIEFLFMFNFISLTSISRDGSNSNFMKYIPISYEKQCLYKIMPGILLNIIPIMYVMAILIFLANLNLITIIYIVILSMFINIFNNYVMIIIDLKNPKLEWISEYAVVKQNLNMLFQMIITMIEVGIFILISTIFTNLNNVAIIFILIMFVLILLVRKYISKSGVKLFRKIV